MRNRFDIKGGALSKEEVITSIEHAFNSEACWRPYFDHFNDLFANDSEVEAKAKSQSVGYLCIQLYRNNNCSIDRLYSILMDIQLKSVIDFSSEIIDLNTKDSFFHCLQKLDGQRNS